MRCESPWVTAALLLAEACANTPRLVPPGIEQVPNHGGLVIAAPRLVTITYANDANRADLEAHAHWMFDSGWLANVGSEYGVTGGSVLGAVELSDPAPASTTDARIRSALVAMIASGTVPTPSDGDFSSVLYVLHFPARTPIATPTGDSCVEFFGYHAHFHDAGRTLVYAVEVECVTDPTMDLPTREEVTSHELFEAATDPLFGERAGWFDDAWSHPVVASNGIELGDLCVLPASLEDYVDGAFRAQRVWSNRAAATGDDPCVPAPTQPFVTLTVTPSERVRVQPGQHLTFQITGHASDTDATAPWSILASRDLAHSAWLDVVLPATMIGEGETTTLDLDVAATAPAGTTAYVALLSTPTDTTSYGISVPIVITVATECAARTECGACALDGCGWCASSGRCVEGTSDGPSDGSCGGSDWMPVQGACLGACAARTDCASCTATLGCGWCDGAGCTRLSGDYFGAADGSCPEDAWHAWSGTCS